MRTRRLFSYLEGEARIEHRLSLDHAEQSVIVLLSGGFSARGKKQASGRLSGARAWATGTCDGNFAGPEERVWPRMPRARADDRKVAVESAIKMARNQPLPFWADAWMLLHASLPLRARQQRILGAGRPRVR